MEPIGPREVCLAQMPGLPQMQPQLVTQLLSPSRAESQSFPRQDAAANSSVQGAMSTFGQIFMTLMNYKMQWLNSLAERYMSGSGALGGGLPGSNSAANYRPQYPPAPVAPMYPAAGAGNPAAAGPGYPFMTTLVTTLSGHSPGLPGVTIAGAPVSHAVYPGRPLQPYPAAQQDVHWGMPVRPPSAAEMGQPGPVQQQQQLPQQPQNSSAAAAPTPAPAPPQVPVLPLMDVREVTTLKQSTATPPSPQQTEIEITLTQDRS